MVPVAREGGESVMRKLDEQTLRIGALLACNGSDDTFCLCT
jgi:hypothetical protein